MAATASVARASTKSVAPKSRAIASLAGLASTATIRTAPAIHAACTALSPMPPTPKTATVSPRPTLARFQTAPAPVSPPHAVSEARSSGTPAAAMRTLTSLAPGPRASRSSVTSILPFQTTPFTTPPCSSARPDDALQLAVGVQPEVATIAAHTTHLEPAERCLQVALGGVDADVTRPQLPGHPEGPRRVLRVHVVVEAVLAVVGEGDGLVLAVHGDHHHDGVEGLLPGQPHVVAALGEQRRLDVVPAFQGGGPAAAGDQFCSFVDPEADVVLDPLALRSRAERPHDRVALHRVTDLERS